MKKKKKEEIREIFEVFQSCQKKKGALFSLFSLLSAKKLNTFLEVIFNLIYNEQLTSQKKFSRRIHKLRALMKPHEANWIKMLTRTKSLIKRRTFLQEQCGDGFGAISAIVALVPLLLNL